MELQEFKAKHPNESLIKVIESPKIIIFEVKSLSDFWELVKLYSDDYLFRGHGDSTWNLQTSLERHSNDRESELCHRFSNRRICNNYKALNGIHSPTLRDEFFAIEEYRSLAQLNGKNAIEILASMQHYGAKTRLLDVTSSIFIALFFAFENYSPKDKAIWAFSEKYFYSTCKALTEDVNKRCEQTKDSHFQDSIIEDYLDMQTNPYILYKECIKKANQCFHSEQNDMGYEYGIIPIKLTGNNPRLVAQNGSFLFPMTLRPFERNLHASLNIDDDKQEEWEVTLSSIKEFGDDYIFGKVPVIKFIFSADFHEHVEAILKQANISARSIYPDMTGIARSVRYWK